MCLKNIPTKLNVDYKWEITNIMENYALMDSEYKLTVKKVVLVYDIEEIVKLEKQMEHLIDRKKDTIIKNNYNFTTREIDEEIEKLEHTIHAVEEEYQHTNKAFCGIAYVSYDTEEMKDKVLQDNTHTWSERLCAFFNRGKSSSLTHEDLSWHDQKLFIEPAPEPNDIDWEFIHISTSEKLVARLKAFVLYAIFEGFTFYVIYVISMQLAHAVDDAHEEDLKGDISDNTLIKIKCFCYLISLGIVLFNKLGVAKILHYIVDLEKISNKTKFQISYGTKYSIALFSNAALMSYIIDILILDNIIGYGGFIYNESLIFILNAILPPLVWLIDPWNIVKKWQRHREIDDISKSVVTQ